MSLNDPQWGKRGGGNEGPPDLDEMWRRFNQKLNGLFGRRRGGEGDPGEPPSVRQLSGGAGLIALVVPFLALIGLFLMHWALGLVVLPFVVLVGSVPSWLLRRAEEQGQAMRHELGELGANVVDVVQGVREVATTGSGLRFLERIGQQHERLARVSIAHGRRSGLEQGATDALTAFAMIATLAVAAGLVTHGAMPARWFPAAVILTGGSFAPIVAVTGVAREVSQVAAAADRITELLEARPAVADLVQRSPAGQFPDGGETSTVVPSGTDGEAGPLIDQCAARAPSSGSKTSPFNANGIF